MSINIWVRMGLHSMHPKHIWRWTSVRDFRETGEVKCKKKVRGVSGVKNIQMLWCSIKGQDWLSEKPSTDYASKPFSSARYIWRLYYEPSVLFTLCHDKLLLHIVLIPFIFISKQPHNYSIAELERQIKSPKITKISHYIFILFYIHILSDL